MGCGPSTQSAAQLANDISGEPPLNGDVIAPVKYREFYLFLEFSSLFCSIFVFLIFKLNSSRRSF